MKYERWLSCAVGMFLVMGPFPARADEVLVCAFDNPADLTLMLDGDAGANLKLDDALKYKNKPTISILGNWTKAWGSVAIELKPVEFAGVPEAISMAFKGDTNMNGLIHFTIKDSKGETMRAILCKAVNKPGWQELRAVPPWQEPTWDGGDGNRILNPPCTLTSLILFARQPIETSVHLADLKVTLPAAKTPPAVKKAPAK